MPRADFRPPAHLRFSGRAETRGEPFRDKRVEAGEHYPDSKATHLDEWATGSNRRISRRPGPRHGSELRFPCSTIASDSDALCIFLCYSELMTVSLRNLPKDVEKAILETSHREGISLNKATIRLLEAQLRKPARNSDFEEFCGTWSNAEADAFDAALIEMRQVDPADWESAG